MRKKLFVLVFCLALVSLFSVAGFASLHGLFEGYSIVKVVVDGQEVTGDTPAINFNGRTMVPVRFVSEALGTNVEWDAANETVVITTGKTPAPSPSAPEPAPEPAPAPGQNEYTVKDSTGKALFSFKINKITEMSERNQFSDKNPAQVIIIDYTYTNIANGEDVYLGDIYFKVVDAAGKLGYTYPNTPTYFPQSTPVGATCSAQMIFGLDTKSDVVTLHYFQNMMGVATASFEIAVE